MELQKLINWDFCERSFAWLEDKRRSKGLMFHDTLLHKWISFGQMLKFNLPKVAISYNKMPNDQLEGHRDKYWSVL